jgi:GNAT superfamily N-acetyltransferase
MSADDATITVRPATEADAGIILNFIRALAEYEKLTDMVIATERCLRKYLFGPHPVAQALIGSLDGSPVGFALFFQTFSTFLAKPGIYLEDLFVIPTARGKGVGHALLREVARIAIARDCGRLEWAVLNWNDPAIEFYEKLGARPLDDWTIYRITGDTLRILTDGSTT